MGLVATRLATTPAEVAQGEIERAEIDGLRDLRVGMTRNAKD